MPADQNKAKSQPETGVRERSKLERQDRIMLAARKLFAEHGYDATTLRQIATNAGLGLGTVFNYVTDKRDLIYLIFNEEMDSLTDRALAAPREWQTFPQKVLTLSEPHFRLFASEATLARILLSEILLQTPGKHLERYRAIRDRFLRGLEAIIAESQDRGELRSGEPPELIARQVFFIISGHLRWWLASCDEPDWKVGLREFDRMLTLHMNGLAQNRAGTKATNAAPRKAAGRTRKVAHTK